MRLLLLCALLALARHAQGQDEDALRISGTVRAQAYQAQAQPGTPDYYGITVLARAEPRLTASTDAKLELRATNVHVDAMGPGAPSRADLLEAWVATHFDHTDVRIGKQIVVWGRADGINPTDNLNGRDLRTWMPFDEDQRIGNWALRVDSFLDEQRNWTVFAAPRPVRTRSRVPVLANPVADNLPGGSPQLGLKWNQSGAGFDYSLSYFRGNAPQGVLVQEGVNAAGPLLGQHYDPLQVFGADMAATVGRTGVRAEVAYTTLRDDAAQRKPNLYWVAGVDRTLVDNLNVNLQLFGRTVRDFDDPALLSDPKQRYLAVQNAISTSQQDAHSYGLTLRVSDKWLGETLEGELLVIRNMTRNNSMLRPTLSYALTDRWKVVGGAVWYQGAPETLFGRRLSDRRLLAELRYGF
jgi:hypothetical protein